MYAISTILTNVPKGSTAAIHLGNQWWRHSCETRNAVRPLINGQIKLWFQTPAGRKEVDGARIRGEKNAKRLCKRWRRRVAVCECERVGVCVCLLSVLGSVLFPSGALARADRFQTNSPEHVAGSAVPAGPPAALQSCRPQCKQVAEPASLRKHGYTEWAAGSSAEKKEGKKISKNPHWPPSSVELAKMEKKFWTEHVVFFFFTCFLGNERIVWHKQELSFAQLVVGKRRRWGVLQLL